MEMTTAILTRMEGHANTTNIQAYDHCMSVVGNARISARYRVDGEYFSTMY